MRSLIRRTLSALGLYAGRLPHPCTVEHHLRTLIDRLGITVVFDVGAHWGEYGTRLRAHGYHGRIVSFEPVPESVARLMTAAAHDPDWLVYPIALGDADGDVTLHVAPDRTDFASMLMPNAYSAERFGAATLAHRAVTVPMRRLESIADEAIRGITAPTALLKMDTQGADLRVLAGVGRARPMIAALQTELAVKPLYAGMPAFHDALATIAAMGFEITGLFPVTRDHDGLRVIEVDGVFRSAPHTSDTA